MSEPTPCIQDLYPEDVASCFGCGPQNPHGHQLRSYPDGEHTIARFTPKDHHLAMPGFVYGGLIASLIDCHGTGTAAWVASEGARPIPRFVTGKLEVSYQKPTPTGAELELVGTVREKKPKKVVVDVELRAEGQVTAVGTVTAVRLSS